jgi:NAD(P)-dependent dehydrogenase (short-subunit alcohol dehydrogenase family)
VVQAGRKDSENGTAHGAQLRRKADVGTSPSCRLIGKGIEEISLDDWNKLVAVNMTGVFLGTKLPLRRCAKRRSPASIVGSQLDPLYSMTKGGVTLFTKSRTFIAAGRRRLSANVGPSADTAGVSRASVARRTPPKIFAGSRFISRS